RQEQSLAGLLGVSLLGILLDKDFAFEDRGRFVGKDMLVQLVARAVGSFVVQECVVIDVLLATGVDQAVEGGFRAFTIEDDRQVVACKFATQTRRVAN